MHGQKIASQKRFIFHALVVHLVNHSWSWGKGLFPCSHDHRAGDDSADGSSSSKMKQQNGNDHYKMLHTMTTALFVEDE